MKATSVLLVILMIFSCTNRIDKIEPKNKIEVQFGITGEHLESTELHTKGVLTSDDLVAIQVYEKTEGGSKYNPYAYGIWDNTENLSVILNQGYTYKLEVTIVPNAKNIISYNAADKSYRQPFTVMKSGGNSKVNNEFIYSSLNYFSLLSVGTSAIKTSTTYKVYDHPIADRYYAELSNIAATTNMQALTIDTKRVVFGLKYDIQNFTEGEITVLLNGSDPITLTTVNHATTQTIYTLGAVSAASGDWIKDNYEEDIQLTITWKKNSSAPEITLIDKVFSFKRMREYTVQADIEQTRSDGGISISLSDEPFINGGVLQK